MESVSFVYDEKRWCKRAGLFVKTLGLAFYTTTITSCDFVHTGTLNTNVMLAVMLAVMQASVCNTLRYEYALYQKYGTVFESPAEFNAWKAGQWPGSRHALSGLEFCVKVIFLAMSAPRLEFIFTTEDRTISMCETGKSVFKIHSLVLAACYTLAAVFFVCMFISFKCGPKPNLALQRGSILRRHSHGHHHHSHRRSSNEIANRSVHVVIDAETECCICLDNTDRHWVSTPCAHSFHKACISEWVARSPSCPVCRVRLELNL